MNAFTRLVRVLETHGEPNAHGRAAAIARGLRSLGVELVASEDLANLIGGSLVAETEAATYAGAMLDVLSEREFL